MSSFSLRASRLTAIVAAALVAACQNPIASDLPSPTTDRSPTAVNADATIGWNQVARDLVAKNLTSAPASIRTFALLSVAQYNAIVTAEKKGPQVSDRGAVAGASAAVLAYVYPQDAAFIEGLVAAQRVAPPQPNRKHDDFAAGEAVGRSIAEPLIARAQTDRFSAPFTGTLKECLGCWTPAPPGPAFATLGQAKPYFLETTAQFRPAAPPAFGSAAFLTSLAEVRQIADTRTTVQDSIAKFWALPAGTVGAQGQFNAIAADLAREYHRSERETAHMLALLNIAAYDGLLASHEAKYYYWLLRPSQADPMIVRAIGLPNFPSYPSNHSMLAGVAAAILGAHFPGERVQLDAMAEEAAMSRVFGGIHYRFDADVGLTLGRTVASWTLAHDVNGHNPFVLSQ